MRAPLSFFAPECLRLYVDHGFRCAAPAHIIARAWCAHVVSAICRDASAGSVELCCEPATESTIFALGPRSGAEERLPRVLCPVVVAVGGRDAHDGPAVVSPGVAKGVKHGRLERCVQIASKGTGNSSFNAAQARASWSLGAAGGTGLQRRLRPRALPLPRR